VSEGEIWVLIGLCAAVTAVIKAAGPVALGGRALPGWFAGVIQLMAPALLAALVCVSALADGEEWAIGPDTAGVAAAGVVLWRGANVVVGVVVAAAVTALLRAL
jgi:branched-subunit amino acid transport protein